MTQLSKEYGEALFLLAKETHQVNEISSDLALLKRLLSENAEYLEFLSCPSIPLSERLTAVEEAFGTSCKEYTLSFFKLLCEKGYSLVFFDCVDEYFALEKRWKNRMSVKVSSAVALSEGQKEELCKKLEHTYRKQIDASYVVEPSLLGGIRIDTGDTVIDASVKQKLKQLKGVISE